MACMMNEVTLASSSTWSIPMKACRNPIITIVSRAKKIKDSFIITLRTTIIAPKNRNVSRYRSNRIQNMGALKAKKL